jgi:hypothetical protein
MTGNPKLTWVQESISCQNILILKTKCPHVNKLYHQLKQSAGIILASSLSAVEVAQVEDPLLEMPNNPRCKANEVWCEGIVYKRSIQ